MTERFDLLSSIAETIADYREADIEAPTPEHVDEWIAQFDTTAQVPILREMDHVLKTTYFSRDRTRNFMAGLFQTEKLVGDDPCAFWKGVTFLDIQGGGASQKEMVALFSKVLEKNCGFTVDDCGTDPHIFVYLDDAIFTGARVHHDLAAWIGNDAPDEAHLHVIVIATHQGAYYNKDKIGEARRASGKNIKIR